MKSCQPIAPSMYRRYLSFSVRYIKSMETEIRNSNLNDPSLMNPGGRGLKKCLCGGTMSSKKLKGGEFILTIMLNYSELYFVWYEGYVVSFWFVKWHRLLTSTLLIPVYEIQMYIYYSRSRRTTSSNYPHNIF